MIHMKTKIACMAALLSLGAMTASAQKAGEFRFGVTAGMNVPKITDINADCRIGFHAGVRAEYNFTDNLYGSLGLLFTQKGAEYDAEYKGVSAKYKMNPGYLELPLQIGYRFHVGDNVSIFGETGPYFAFGVCGKHKVDVDSPIGGGDMKTDFFGDDGANVFDGGWGLRLGVEVSKFQIGLGYEYGFSKVWDESSSHNSNFTIGLSYMF